MLKLNLLPASYMQKGGVRVAAIMAIIVWLVVLVALWFIGESWRHNISVKLDHAKQQQPDIDLTARLKADETAYETELATIEPETAFLDQVDKEPQQMMEVMRAIARGTPADVVVKSYTITPNQPTVTLSAIALDYEAYNRWRLDLLTDPDFVGVPQISSVSGAGSTGGGGMGGFGGRGGYPGGGMGGYPGGMSRGSFGGMGGGQGNGGGAQNFNFPSGKFPQAIPVTVTLTLKNPVTAPAFSPGGGGGAGGGMGGGMGGYPGGMGGYPGGMGGYPGGMGGYPGGGGGYPSAGGGYPSAGAGPAATAKAAPS